MLQNKTCAWRKLSEIRSIVSSWPIIRPIRFGGVEIVMELCQRRGTIGQSELFRTSGTLRDKTGHACRQFYNFFCITHELESFSHTHLTKGNFEDRRQASDDIGPQNAFLLLHF